MMTKQDFSALAAALAESRPAGDDARAQWARDIGRVAGVCAMSNKRFDVDRFVEACKAVHE